MSVRCIWILGVSGVVVVVGRWSFAGWLREGPSPFRAEFCAEKLSQPPRAGGAGGSAGG